MNDPYTSGTVHPAADPALAARLAGRLQLAGDWDGALSLLPGQDGDAAGRRAGILVDRYWWRLDDPAPAEQAVAGLEDQARRGYLAAQLAYTRLLFRLGPRPGDEQAIADGLREAVRHGGLRGWATFWQGVVADNLHGDPGTAARRYGEALAQCRAGQDLLLESYVVRHQGAHLIDGDPLAGEMLLRRSLYLRAALGARPLTAAAQATLAGVLQPGAERDTLLQAARATAAELSLTWLNEQLTGA
jgi:hypothetical protein